MKPNYKIHDQLYIEAQNNGWTGWGGNDRVENAKELVSRYLDLEFPLPGGNLLELGCGEGCHSRKFAELGFKVTGVDISETAVNWAKTKAKDLNIPGTFITADLTDPKLRLSKKFNVVIDGNCLHCIIGSDRDIFIKNVYRLLSPGGIFFVSSLCAKTDENKIIEQHGVEYRYIASVKLLVSELIKVGFSILKTTVHERPDYNHVTIHALKS